jgi:hypothetical protein
MDQISRVKKVLKIYRTVRFLKFTQIFYQIKYRLTSPRKLKPPIPGKKNATQKLIFKLKIPQVQSATNEAEFTFLNLKVNFNNAINWDFQENGKLWNYNLQYFNYLNQDNINDVTKQEWLIDICSWLKNDRLKPEPYPVSLRVINTIKFINDRRGIDTAIVNDVFAQLVYLNDNLEYHILGNHLLENAFALFMGGHFFNVNAWCETAKAILYKELNEQVLDDGAHFELSPMYHQIIFFRVLELADWYTNVNNNDDDFLMFIKQKAADMLKWLQLISFKNGDIPHFNDSATGITFTTPQLQSFAQQLNISANNQLNLKGSGYRKYESEKYECIIDVGAVGPSYQPGHSHSDALSFILYSNNLPVFVDAGTSTYQIGGKRSYERSTNAHNTVEVSGQNQSEVWGGFRVGRRAQVQIQTQLAQELCASHNGYKKILAADHSRCFTFADNVITIKDIISAPKPLPTKALFHLYAGYEIDVISKNEVLLNKTITMRFTGVNKFEILNYELADGYNKYLPAQYLSVEFNTELQTSIIFQ